VITEEKLLKVFAEFLLESPLEAMRRHEVPNVNVIALAIKILSGPFVHKIGFFGDLRQQ